MYSFDETVPKLCSFCTVLMKLYKNCTGGGTVSTKLNRFGIVSRNYTENYTVLVEKNEIGFKKWELGLLFYAGFKKV